MNGHARALARAVLIYHGVGVPDQPRGETHRDTLAEWMQLTGTKRCTAAPLLDLARRVLAEPDTQQSPDQEGVSE